MAHFVFHFRKRHGLIRGETRWPLVAAGAQARVSDTRSAGAVPGSAVDWLDGLTMAMCQSPRSRVTSALRFAL